LRKSGVNVSVVRMTVEKAAEAIDLYESGLSLGDIGEKMGACKTTISRALAKACIELRLARRVSRKA
jgi:predicted DNA-binding protein (UPF0251 family)